MATKNASTEAQDRFGKRRAMRKFLASVQTAVIHSSRLLNFELLPYSIKVEHVQCGKVLH